MTVCRVIPRARHAHIICIGISPSKKIGRNPKSYYTVSYVDNSVPKYGFIRYYLNVAVIAPLTPTSHYCYAEQLSVLYKRLLPVRMASSVVVVCTKSLLNKSVCVDLSSTKFISELPNQLYFD